MVLGAECPVDPSPENPEDFPVLQRLLGGEPPLEHGPDAPKGLPAIDPGRGGELGAGEHSAVEASQGDPFALGTRPAERLECVLSSG